MFPFPPLQPVKQPLKEVNFNMEPQEIDCPCVIPEAEMIDKPDGKPDKGKRFLFFKKKKPKVRSLDQGTMREGIESGSYSFVV